MSEVLLAFWKLRFLMFLILNLELAGLEGAKGDFSVDGDRSVLEYSHQ